MVWPLVVLERHEGSRGLVALLGQLLWDCPPWGRRTFPMPMVRKEKGGEESRASSAPLSWPLSGSYLEGKWGEGREKLVMRDRQSAHRMSGPQRHLKLLNLFKMSFLYTDSRWHNC